MYFAPSRPKDFLEIKKNPRNAAGIEPATLAGHHSPTLYRYTMPPTPYKIIINGEAVKKFHNILDKVLVC